MLADERGRAVSAGRTAGFVKIIAGPRRVLGDAGGGQVLGATVVAGRAGEMLGELALAIRAGLFTGRLAQTVHAYPTWSVAVEQAAAQFFAEFGGRSAQPAEAGRTACPAEGMGVPSSVMLTIARAPQAAAPGEVGGTDRGLAGRIRAGMQRLAARP